MRVSVRSAIVAGGLVGLLAIAGCASKKDLKLEMTRETVIHPPVISAIAFDPSGEIDTRGRGSTVRVTMTGDPGLEATFDVEGRFEGRSMEEVEPGVYRGSFEVTPGDQADLWVVGHLVHAESGASQDYRADRALALRPSTPPPPEPRICTREMAADFDKAIRGLTVYFEFDKYDLTSQARMTLSKNAGTMMEHAGFSILIEGHCDERGTEEYNLALGEKRALAARDYLTGFGIAKDRISVISFGEEKPVDPRHNEEAWAKNRRAQFVVTK